MYFSSCLQCEGKFSDSFWEIDCQLFLQPKWVYSESAKNCSLGSTAMANPMHILPQQGEYSFKEGKRKLESCSKQSPLEKLRVWSIVAFCCLTCDSLLSLRELLPGKKKFFFFLLGSATVISGRAPFSDLPSLFWLRFVFINFLYFLLLIKTFLWKHCW